MPVFPTVDPIVRTVNTIIKARGGDVAVEIATGETEYDYETSTSIPVVIPFTGRAVVFDYLQKMDGIGTTSPLVQRGDRQMFMLPAAGVPRITPETTTLIWDGRKYAVITSKELNPSGSSLIVYELFIRG